MFYLSKPLILSFEYNTNKKILLKILDFIKSNQIKTISITNIVPLSFIKNIEADFISIDVDYFELNCENINKIKQYNKKVGQLRIIIEDPIPIRKLEVYLKKIEKNYHKSKILFYKFSISDLNIDNVLNIIKYANKFKFIPSLMPVDAEINSKNAKLLINLLGGYHKEIAKEKILIDSPCIMTSIMKKEYICPSANLMCHIDYVGNFKVCKFDSAILGNIDNNSISSIWNMKNKENKKHINKNSNCLIRKFTQEPYCLFSAMYDGLMSKKSLYNEYADFIKNGFSNKNLKILDVACGTGILIKKLSKNYKYIEGLEKSEKMAGIARKKTLKKIYIGDMANFKIKKKYDLILCTFDSLNYILDINLLEKAFRNFYRHLNKNGEIIFDVNPLGKFKKHFNAIEEQKIHNKKIKWISSYSYPFWRIRIQFINKNGADEETHYERFYSLSVMKRLLKDSKFNKIKVFKDSFKNEGNGKKRIFISAQRKM